MKIFSREFWGTVLIWAGILIFIFVLYDAVRPYFPDKSRYPAIDDIQRTLRSFFSKDRRQSKPAVPPPAASSAPAVRPRPRRPGEMPTADIHQTGGNYNLWIWEVLAEPKPGEPVRVEIAHAAAGEKGGFFIVAFADTDGDGQPDREIARSPFLTADAPGKWSDFQFPAPGRKIFVGSTWPEDSNTFIYRSNGKWPEGKNMFADRFYHTVSPGKAISAGPAFTNLRISFPANKD